MARPSSPPFQTETKYKCTRELSFTILSQSPPFNSAWQFEHQGAHRCTTLNSCDLVASNTFCSAAEGSARSDIAVSRMNTDARRKIDMWFKYGEKRSALKSDALRSRRNKFALQSLASRGQLT